MCVPVVFALLSIVLALGAYLAYDIRRLVRTTFTDRGVVFRRPWPIFGNVVELLFGRTSLVEMTCDFYNEFKAIG